MSQIRVLPVHIVNKIAAGEVIERPASIVKELVENSLDAGASRICVSVEDGGKKLIAVTDDGSGISDEDLALAFSPHATSKIAGDEDLFSIGTMGFRGEALASIASVSHAHIRTRRREDDSGYEIEASGDTTGQVRPCAAAAGTTITVRNVFFNTPARRRFMRTTNTELGHITEQLARLALPHPQVAFTLTHNGREIQNLPRAESTAQRASGLFGNELGDALLPLVRRGGTTVQINGLVAAPSAARGSGKWQYFFVNGRYVRDRSLSHALREAYRGLIEPSRWPVAFIFVEIDPGDVDVNVHPTKIEVRFRNSQEVHGELLATLKETLNRADLTARADLAPAAEQATPPAQRASPTAVHRESLREALSDFFKSAPAAQPRLSFEQGRAHPTNSDHRPQHANQPAPDIPRRDTRPEAAEGTSRNAFESHAQRAPAPPAAQEAPTHEPGLFVAQLNDSYIVAAVADGLEIIDQHALHERLIYNDLHRRLAGSDSPGLTAQRLLIPERIKVTAAEAATLHDNSALLARLGIDLAPFGPDTLAVQQFPSLLAERGISAGQFLREVIDRLGNDEPASPEALLESLLEMLACKAAVKAGQSLSQEEIRALLARRDEADKSSSCPHGRPTTLKLTLKELEKQFRRT